MRPSAARPAGGTGASRAAARTGRVASMRSMTAAPIEWPISTGGTGKPGRHAQHRRRNRRGRSRTSVRALPKRRVRAATARARRSRTGLEPRQEVGRPAPRIAIAAVDGEQRRLAAIAVPSRETQAGLRVRFEGQRRWIGRSGIRQAGFDGRDRFSVAGVGGGFAGPRIPMPHG